MYINENLYRVLQVQPCKVARMVHLLFVRLTLIMYSLLLLIAKIPASLMTICFKLEVHNCEHIEMCHVVIG